MSGNIFISYRRDDAAAWAGRLHMALEKHFRRDQLFMDVDSIQAGLDFAKVIDAEVAKCDVMLVVIGKGWVDARDAGGRRRLDDASDFVRLEVESALRRDIRVVPVLVDGASLPKAEELPEGMRGLVRRQAWPLSHARFGAECEGLIGEISRYVTPAGGSAAAPARTDWAAEASKFFFYLLGGVGLVAGVAGIGFGVNYLSLGRWGTPEDGYGLIVSPSIALWLVLAASLAFASRRQSVSQVLAHWIVSAASAAWVAMICSAAADRGPANPKLLMAALAVASALYVIVSGPALILWRRRKRRG